MLSLLSELEFDDFILAVKSNDFFLLNSESVKYSEFSSTMTSSTAKLLNFF